MRLAPVVLFVYNRPRHARRTVEALAMNGLAAQSDLVIFSDAARTQEQELAVSEVRGYLGSVRGFKSVRVVERERNLGLAGSVIAGVSEVVAEAGRVIVLEDDMVTSPHFLRFMNEGLEMYRDAEKVIGIHGYVYPVGVTLPETFFLKGADCWGWATWKRGWDLFESDGRRLLAELEARNLTDRFDFHGAHPYTAMLKDQIDGKADSWAVRWYASALLKGMHTLYPGKSLVKNIGVDSSGTNCGDSGRYDVELGADPVAMVRQDVVEDELALESFMRYFKSGRVPLHRRILGRLGLGGR